MLADLSQIEMLQATVAGVMEKYHDQHDLRAFDIVESR